MQNKKQSPSKTSQSIKLMQVQKCAYHSKQAITNFCKCEECLLPVCPTCIKVHIDEHKVHKTTPQFEEINKVVEQIRACYQRLAQSAETIRKLLTGIEAQKKQKEQKIRKKLLDNRNILIRQFEKRLIEMQNRFIDEIVKDDEEFVNSMSQLDQELSKTQNSINKSQENINNEDLLKHIIIFFGKKSNQKYTRQLEYIKSKSRLLTKKQIQVIIDESQIDAMSEAVQQYMRMEIIDKQLEIQH